MQPLRHTLTSFSLLEMLRRETAGSHRRLEATVALLGAHASRARYVAFLRGLAAIHTPIEAQLSTSDAYREVVADAVSRRRAHLLIEDLRELGEAAPVAESIALPGLSEELGAAYVFEGSTLGGRVLTRELTARLRLPADTTRYIAGYGEHTGERWREFLDGLARAQGRDDVDPYRVVHAAAQIFERLRLRFDREMEHLR